MPEGAFYKNPFPGGAFERKITKNAFVRIYLFPVGALARNAPMKVHGTTMYKTKLR